MDILNIRSLKGPNYWSNWRHRLMVMTIDIEAMDHCPSNELEGFTDRIMELLPSLIEHRCSRGYEGGFLERLQEGTYMGHIIEHVALELQTLAGMACGFGRTRGHGEEGVYDVVFSYEEERAGYYAGYEAFRLVQALIDEQSYDPGDLEVAIQHLREIREEESFGPSTGSIVEEAKERRIPLIRLNEGSLIQLGWGMHQERIQATVTGRTSNIGLELASDKDMTKRLLEEGGIPVPHGHLVRDKEDLKARIAQIGFPLAIKPADGNQGKGATIKIMDPEEAEQAFDHARGYSSNVLVESYIKGFDLRLLVIGHKLVAAARRTPAHVVGDGSSNIDELIDEVNADPRRGFGHEKMLTEIKVDRMTQELLAQEGLTTDSVLPKDRILYLKTTANLSTGGISEDVTDRVHPSNVFMAERIAKILDLDICGIDVIAPDLARPISENDGAVLEVNGAPGFRMHLEPTTGTPRNVAAPVLDMLFPDASNGRIPIVSVTGTNGKTTVTRLIAHIMRTNGKKVGTATSDGIYHQNRLVQKGDCSGPNSARSVFRDPDIDYAVLETARGGILRSGLGYDEADVGVLTNVDEDHIGLNGIHSIDQMARVKSTVVENITENGYAVLNADDPNVMGMMEGISANLALFSIKEGNEAIEAHCKEGGIAGTIEEGELLIRQGDWRIPIEKVTRIPLTFEGRAGFQIQNVLAAVSAAFVEGVKVEEIRVGLQTFTPSPTQTPGRTNLFEFEDLKVLLDYAHNQASMKAMGRFVQELGSGHKICCIAGTGDRNDEEMKGFAWQAAEYFDEVIIWKDEDYSRGRNSTELVNLLHETAKNHPQNRTVRKVATEDRAIEEAFRIAGTDRIVCLFTARQEELTRMLQEKKERESESRRRKEEMSENAHQKQERSFEKGS